MIQNSVILSELYGTGKSVVGFRQPMNPDFAILTGANIESTSGIYLSDGLVTIENIKELQEYADISNADFNTQLANQIKDSIINACNLVFQKNDKKEYGLLFNQKNLRNETLENNGDFVGFEINAIKKQT